MTLALQSRGRNVRLLQAALIRDGFLPPVTTTGRPNNDGAFGPLTAAAVILAQHAHGLPTTGEAGPELLELLGVTATPAPSNAIVCDGRTVALPAALRELGISASNYIDDGEHHFDAHARTRRPVHAVLHEAVAEGPERIVDILRTRKTSSGMSLGVPLILAQDLHLSCHNDLVREAPIHGNQLNRTSVGIELELPYNPAFDRGPKLEVIASSWWTWVPNGKAALYCRPSDTLMRALQGILRWTSELAGFPYQFPTKHLGPHLPRIHGWQKGAKPGPGIVAHRDYWSHSDGRWPLEWLIHQEA